VNRMKPSKKVDILFCSIICDKVRQQKLLCPALIQLRQLILGYLLQALANVILSEEGGKEV
jgi:hypothetical protein